MIRGGMGNSCLPPIFSVCGQCAQMVRCSTWNIRQLIQILSLPQIDRISRNFLNPSFATSREPHCSTWNNSGPDTHSSDFHQPATESAVSVAPCENCTVFPMESVPPPPNAVALALTTV